MKKFLGLLGIRRRRKPEREQDAPADAQVSSGSTESKSRRRTPQSSRGSHSEGSADVPAGSRSTLQSSDPSPPPVPKSASKPSPIAVGFPYSPPRSPVFGSATSPPALSPRALERRRRHQTGELPELDHNDPFTELSEMHDALQDLDILNYTTLRSLLESKLGKGAHLDRQEMVQFKQATEQISRAFRQFMDSLAVCAQFKLGPAPSNGGSLLDKRDNVNSDPPKYTQGSATVPLGDAKEKVKETEQVPAATAAPPNPVQSSPVSYHEFADKPEFKTAVDVLRKDFQTITELITSVQQLIHQHKSCIDPAAILLANSDVGNLQRYYVHTKYKEMVKGCGGNRSQYTSLWAGTEQPGDAWMNELLRCYWRELEGKPYVLPAAERKKWRQRRRRRNRTEVPSPTQTASLPSISDSEDNDDEQSPFTGESDMLHRLDLMTARASNPHVLDVIAVHRVIDWMKAAKLSPELHSRGTLDRIDDAAEKMGGWRFLDSFCLNWVKQFYLQVGRKAVPFPLPGCKSWLPDSDCTTDCGFQNSPLSMTLHELNCLASPQSPMSAVVSPVRASLREQNLRLTVPSDFPLHGEVAPRQDQKYWDYVWLSVCRTLLDTKELVQTELQGEEGIQQWITSVEMTGLLTQGSYVVPPLDPLLHKDSMCFGDSLPMYRRNLLHPGIVRIREKGIVINACLNPQHVRYLLRVEEEIRQEFSKIPSSSQLCPPLVIPQPNPTTSTNIKMPPSYARRTHKKSYSTGGVMDNSRKAARRQQPTGTLEEARSASDIASVGKTNILQPPESPTAITPTSQVSVDSLGRRRDRAHSAPLIPFEAWSPQGSGGFSNLYLETQRICRLIASKPKLPKLELAERAFAMSEVVVKHYLTHELPAKYQSAY